MSIKTNYDKIIEEIKTLKIPYDNVSDNIIWLPKRCSEADKNDNLICIVYHTDNDTLRIEFITKVLSEIGRRTIDKLIRFENENEIDFHFMLSKILNYYYKEIDKSP